MGQIYITTGEFGKAVQSMRQAVSDDPSNPYRHGNLGMAYYRNQQPLEALQAFTLAIRGGTTSEGVVVQGLPLEYGIVSVYYQMYGLLLARVDRCPEALPLSQALIASVPEDEDALFNAQEMVAICEGTSENPLLITLEPTVPIATPAGDEMDDMVE